MSRHKFQRKPTGDSKKLTSNLYDNTTTYICSKCDSTSFNNLFLYVLHNEENHYIPDLMPQCNLHPEYLQIVEVSESMTSMKFEPKKMACNFIGDQEIREQSRVIESGAALDISVLDASHVSQSNNRSRSMVSADQSKSDFGFNYSTFSMSASLANMTQKEVGPATRVDTPRSLNQHLLTNSTLKSDHIEEKEKYEIIPSTRRYSSFRVNSVDLNRSMSFMDNSSASTTNRSYSRFLNSGAGDTSNRSFSFLKKPSTSQSRNVSHAEQVTYDNSLGFNNSTVNETSTTSILKNSVDSRSFASSTLQNRKVVSAKTLNQSILKQNVCNSSMLTTNNNKQVSFLEATQISEVALNDETFRENQMEKSSNNINFMFKFNPYVVDSEHLTEEINPHSIFHEQFPLFLSDFENISGVSAKSSIMSTLFTPENTTTKHTARLLTQKSLLSNTFKCKFKTCTYITDTNLSLTTHYRLSHYGITQNKKTKIFEKSEKGKCPVCCKNFSCKDAMDKHFHAVHSQRDKEQFTCDRCGKRLADRRCFLQHKNRNTCSRSVIATCRRYRDDRGERLTYKIRCRIKGCNHFTQTKRPDWFYGLIHKRLSHEDLHGIDEIYNCFYCEQDFELLSSYTEHLVPCAKNHEKPACLSECPNVDGVITCYV